MANGTVGKTPLSPVVIIAVIVVVVLLLGFFGWKTLGGGASEDRVPVDANKVKEQLQNGGFGHS